MVAGLGIPILRVFTVCKHCSKFVSVMDEVSEKCVQKKRRCNFTQHGMKMPCMA